MEDAGYDLRHYPGAVGVFVSGVLNTYLLNNLHPSGAHLDQDASRVMTLSSTGGFQVMVANDKDYLPTRISYKLHLRGPSLNIQTACSSSLVAIHVAAQSLLAGECEMALAGGVSISVPQETGYLYQDGLLVSPDGHCRPFDADAQGTIFGNGAGLVLLKKLESAVADGDQVYAVIKGSAVNNDGGQKAGYLAPSQEGQAAVVAEALAAAGINAESISYVEAHGTATALGDPIEIAGLTQAFRADTAREQFCAVGSVKSNIGHLQIASGVAGFIKTALALRHRQLVPSLHFRSPNPRIDFARSPFYVNTRLQDWPAASNPRRASVNSLGIGGTNVHVILEEPPESLPPVRTVDRPRHVLALSGKNRQALRDLAGRWAATADTGGELDLGDACFTANAGRAHLSERIALVVEGWAPLRDKLQQFLAGETLPADVALGCASEAPPQIVFLFSGQNSQHPIAERDLYATSPAFRSAIDECQQALRPLLAEVPSDVLHADAAGGQGPNQPIWTQPRLFALQYALARLWMSWGITPSAVLGHEVGQYVAACIAGVLRLEDALKLVVHQQRLMEGTREPIADAVEAFRQFASELDYSLPHIPIISPFDGSAVPDEVARVDYWCRHVCQPVSLGQTIAAATNRTCDVYLELGPEPTLLPLLRERLEESGRAGEFTLAASLCGDRSPWDTMLQSLAALYVRGVSVDWAGFDRDYVRRRRSVPTYPFQRQRYWVDRPAASLERGGQRASEEQDRRRLLGRRLISTALKDAVFETRIGLESLPILNDHRFCDVPLLPGAFQLAMFFEATQRLGIPASCEMEGVSFTKALTGSSGPEKIAQVIVSSDEGSQRTLQLVAQPVNAEEDDEWTVHSQARLAPVPAATPRLPIEIEPLRQRLLTQARRVVSREEFYAAMRDHRAQLGPRFQAIETAWVGQGEVLCQLRFPEDLKQGDPHWGHMVLLDACVQVLGGAESYSLQHTLVPTAVERFWFLRPPRGERLWCYLRDLSSESGSTEQRIADVWLCEEDGEVIAAFTGLRLDAIPHEVLLNALGEEEVDWVYRQVWSPAPRPASTNARELSGSWLIFADQGGLGTRLSQLIVDQGGRSTIVRPGDRWLRDESAAYHLDPGDPQHFVRLLETAWGTASSSPRGVVYLWGLDQDADPLRLVDSGSSCASATYLLQALAKSGSTHGMDFFLVTRGTQAVDGHSGPTGIGQAPLWGLSRTAGIEYPEMRSVRIDIDAVVGDEPLALLLAELCETGPERDVVLRGSDRYVRRLERQSLSAVSPISIRPDVTYLITGGTGGVGMQLATSLVQQGARHLVLVSRRGPSSSEAQRIAAQWAERGVQAFIWGADVAVEAELHAVLQRIRTELAPLRGVIHAAGVLADGMLQELDWEAFAGVMRAKVVGTWNLHRLTEDQSLDFFVACSSIASLMGSPGQANYSAANAFLDVLMQHRRASGLPGLVVNWGPWNDVGMVTALGDAGRRALARRGLMPLDTAAVLRSFPSLLGSGTAQLVAARIDWQQYLQEGAGTANAAWVQELVRRNAEPADGQGAFRKHLEQAPHADRHRLLLEYVRDLVSGLLGLPAATPIEVETGFHELGLDSLGVLTLRNRLQSSLGLTLPATVGYRFSTIQSLVEYLAETLGLRSPTAFTPPSDDKEEHPEAAPGAELDGLSLPELADRLAEKLAAIRSGYGGT
jgi:acyl transferase domain-containing protein/acyl carrier protein